MARAVRTGSQLDTGLLLACGFLSALAILMPEKWRDSSAAVVRRTVLAPFVSVQQRAEIIRATIVARDSVQNKNAQATGLALNAPALESENTQLRHLIGIGARLQHGFIAAEALQTDAFDRDFTLTITAGTNDGVERFTPVVTADGLLGMVDSMDATMSFAISWAHPSFRVSAMSADGTAFGIVQPHLGTGAERLLLELRNVAFRSKLEVGTLVVSTGIGNLFPRGIPVGTVVGELQTTEKWSRTFLLKPAVLPNALGPVLLMIPSRSQKDVNGVWTTLASADSAARAIVSAGDSMARKAALAELAARRAAQGDSTGTNAADSLLRGITPPGIRGDTTKRAVPRDTAKKRIGPDSVKPKAPTGPPPPLEFSQHNIDLSGASDIASAVNSWL